jgi:hypothetical protein
MTDPSEKSGASDWDSAGIRITVLVLSSMQALFLLYAFHYTLKRANPKGDGMELLGTAPMLLVFAFLTLPALISGIRATSLGRALVFVLIAAMLNAMFFLHLVGQFSGKG